ncbi:MAG TPA: MFS transporter [Ktedonobacterales bacterium]|nr:MFS transporter [Ktedonobacterales bacterium]
MSEQPGAERAYHVYLILEGCQALFFTMIATVNLVYQVEVAHLNPLQLVLVGTMLESVAFVLQVPTGALADVYGRRRAIILGMALVGVGFAIEGLVPNFAVILATQVIWGAGATFMDGALEAWIADEVGEARVGAAFFRGSQVEQLGALAGAGVSVVLASVRLNLPIVAGGALLVLLALFLAAVMPEHARARPEAADERPSWGRIAATARSGARSVRQSPVLLIILAVGACYGASSEGFDRLSAAHYLHDLTIPGLGPFKPVVWFGVMSAGTMLLSLAATELLRRRMSAASHERIARVLFAFAVIEIAGVVAFGLAGSFWLALVAYWGYLVTRRAANPIYTTWLTQSTAPEVRATMISLNGLADAGGQILGGPVIGLVGTIASLRAALVASGVVLAPTLALFALARGRLRAAAAQSEPPVPARH